MELRVLQNDSFIVICWRSSYLVIDYILLVDLVAPSTILKFKNQIDLMFRVALFAFSCIDPCSIVFQVVPCNDRNLFSFDRFCNCFSEYVENFCAESQTASSILRHKSKMILNAIEVLARGLALLHIVFRDDVKTSTKVNEFNGRYGSQLAVNWRFCKFKCIGDTFRRPSRNRSLHLMLLQFLCSMSLMIRLLCLQQSLMKRQ